MKFRGFRVPNLWGGSTSLRGFPESVCGFLFPMYFFVSAEWLRMRVIDRWSAQLKCHPSLGEKRSRWHFWPLRPLRGTRQNELYEFTIILVGSFWWKFVRRKFVVNIFMAIFRWNILEGKVWVKFFWWKCHIWYPWAAQVEPPAFKQI